jgi:general secretion pathway protein D
MNSWLAAALLALAAGGLLGGCAAPKTFREGQTLLAEGKLDEGMAKLEAAVKLDPHNAEYRLVLANRRLALVNGYNQRGDAARGQGALVDAEQFYMQAQKIDPNNVVAKQGLAALVQEKRHQQLLQEAEELLKKADQVSLQDAQEKLRPVLIENPEQRAALALKAKISTQLAKLKGNELQLGSAFRKPITLEFRDAPLRSIVDFIARVSGLNIYFDKDVKTDARTTILTKNTPLEEALRIVLSTNQLEKSVLNQNSILIYPNTPQKLKDYQQLVVRTFFLANGDAKSISYTIKTLLKARDIVTDDRLGLIIMRDTPDMIRMAERLIAVQDVSDPEVMLEVEVLEVKRSRLLNLGINWPDSATLTLAGSTKSTSGVPQLTLEDLRTINRSNINLSSLSTTVNVKKVDSDSNILANPRIRVRNKEKAKILIGDRVPVVTTTSTATGVVGDSVNYVDVGLKFDVEPNIYLDDEVAIKLSLEVSSIVSQFTSKSGTTAYQIGTRNATTVLRLKDGETQVLAGLINDEDRRAANKVPVIGELPVLNRLFGSQEDATTRSEIVLSITPRVLRSLRRPDLEAAEFNSGSENNVGGHVLSVSGGSEGTVQGVGNAQGQPGLPGQPIGGQDSIVPQPGNGAPPPRTPAAGDQFPPRTPLTGGGDDPDNIPTVVAPPVKGIGGAPIQDNSTPPPKPQGAADAPLKPKRLER